MSKKAIRDYLSGLGRKGAKATNAKLTAAERSENARSAALAMWKKRRGKTENAQSARGRGMDKPAMER
jgi:hypothetical protein